MRLDEQKTTMKNLLLIILILFPVSAFAHGEEVLVSFFFDLTTVIALIIFIFCIKWKDKGKILLVLVLIASVVLSFEITSKWPYTENRMLINLLCVGVPLVSVLLTYFIFRRKFRLKMKNQ